MIPCHHLKTSLKQNFALFIVIQLVIKNDFKLTLQAQERVDAKHSFGSQSEYAKKKKKTR